jgi:hypothetical protein
VLLGQDGADEADDRGPVAEDDDVGAAADLLGEPFQRFRASDLTPDGFGAGGEAEAVSLGLVEEVGCRREALALSLRMAWRF